MFTVISNSFYLMFGIPNPQSVLTKLNYCTEVSDCNKPKNKNKYKKESFSYAL
jgi:hypothetical protein